MTVCDWINTLWKWPLRWCRTEHATRICIYPKTERHTKAKNIDTLVGIANATYNSPVYNGARLRQCTHFHNNRIIQSIYADLMFEWKNAKNRRTVVEIYAWLFIFNRENSICSHFCERSFEISECSLTYAIMCTFLMRKSSSHIAAPATIATTAPHTANNYFNYMFTNTYLTLHPTCAMHFTSKTCSKKNAVQGQQANKKTQPHRRSNSTATTILELSNRKRA